MGELQGVSEFWGFSEKLTTSYYPSPNTKCHEKLDWLHSLFLALSGAQGKAICLKSYL